jgi:hypothetical protein
MTPGRWETLAEDLLAGRLADEVPPHGTLCRVRRAVGLPASAPATNDAAGTGRSAASKGAVQGGAKRQAPAALDSAGHLDHAGHSVQLATSRSTAAVGSTLAPGGSPREAVGEGEATGDAP